MNGHDQWCGLCNVYGDHDTAHHVAAGKGEKFAIGDSVVHPKCDDIGCEVPARLHDSRGRIDGERGMGYSVSFPNKGQTITVTLEASKLAPWKPTT